MKSFRLLGSILFSLAIVACMLAPAEVLALVPPSIHDFFMGPDGVVLGAGVFTAINRRARGEANLGGIVKLVLFAEEDFTEDWPTAADITDGETAVVPPLKNGVVGAVLKFDRDTCRVKSNRKGDLGYQTVDVDGECKFAGYSAEQTAAIEKTFNQGGVAIAYYKDGKRAVYGTSYTSLTFEDSTDSGAKSDDKLQMDFKFKGNGYAFHPPMLDSTVVIPLPA